MPRYLPCEPLAREHPANEPRAVALEHVDEAHAEGPLARFADRAGHRGEVVLALAELECEAAHVAEPETFRLGDLEAAAAHVERVRRRGPAVRAVGPVDHRDEGLDAHVVAPLDQLDRASGLDLERRTRRRLCGAEHPADAAPVRELEAHRLVGERLELVAVEPEQEAGAARVLHARGEARTGRRDHVHGLADPGALHGSTWEARSMASAGSMLVRRDT